MPQSMKELFENALPSRPAIPRFVFMCVCAAVCAALPGTQGSLPFTGIAFLLALSALLAFSRSLPALLSAGLLSAAVYVYTQNAFFAVCVCTVTVAVGLFSYLAVTTRSPVVLLILPASYAFAVLAGGSLLSALVALVPFPAAFVLTALIGRRERCAGSVFSTAATLGATVLVTLAVYIFVSNGKADLSLLKDAADDLYNEMLRRYTERFEELVGRYAALGYDVSKLGISLSEIRQTAATVFGILPAVFALAVNAVSYAAHKYSLSLISASGHSKLVCGKTVSFDMSAVSVVVFFISYLVLLVAPYAGGETVALIAENVFLIVLPWLALVGFAVLLGRNRKKKKYIVVTVVLVLMTFTLPSISLAVAAFIGSSSILKTALGKVFAGGNDI